MSDLEVTLVEQDELEFLPRGVGPRGSRYQAVVDFVKEHMAVLVKNRSKSAVVPVPTDWLISRGDRKGQPLGIESFMLSATQALKQENEREQFIPDGLTLSCRQTKDGKVSFSVRKKLIRKPAEA